MAEKYFALSAIGGRLFACKAGKAGESDAQYEDITGELVKATGIKYSRNVKEYDLVNNGGWKIKAFLGQQVSDITLNFVRTSDDDTYQTMKTWAKESVGKEEALKDLVFMIPNDDETFDVSVVTCGIKETTLSGLDTTIGQEYSMTVAVTGGIKYFTGSVADNVPTLTPVE